MQSSAGGPTVVRSRSSDDLAACVRVLREVHRHDGYPTRWPADPAAWLSPPDLVDAWVAALDGTICGHVALLADLGGEHWMEFGSPSRDRAAVSRLFVSPTAQGSGLGAALLHTVMQVARERHLDLVLDVVDSEQSAAIALYERLGWKLVGRRPAGWIAPDGVRPRLRLYAYASDSL